MFYYLSTVMSRIYKTGRLEIYGTFTNEPDPLLHLDAESKPPSNRQTMSPTSKDVYSKRLSDCSSFSAISSASSSSYPSTSTNAHPQTIPHVDEPGYVQSEEYDDDDEYYQDPNYVSAYPRIEISEEFTDDMFPEYYPEPYYPPYNRPQSTRPSTLASSSSSILSASSSRRRLHDFHHKFTRMLSHLHRTSQSSSSSIDHMLPSTIAEVPEPRESRVISSRIPFDKRSLLSLDAAQKREDIIRRPEGFELAERSRSRMH
ncbi:hypothetical protein C8Q75DRAFT_747581 [Abortiporus biennis]|nr:hypothetical protein C8Q75DRAFT_747581 [Abortiporus biennis]